MHPTVLITGASSGIGAAFAHAYAKKKHNVILVARRKEKLEKLSVELEAKFSISAKVLVYDLSDPDTPKKIQAELASKKISVDILVNNAGYGVPGTFAANDWQTHASANQVMVTSVAELTHIFLVDMIKNRNGEVINIASIAGLIPSTAGHTLYGAVKSWMIHFSEALAAELTSSNIKVIAVCPGFTYSEFHDVTGTRKTVSKLPKLFWLSAEDVAEESITALHKREPGKTSIFIPGRFNKCLAVLNRTLPRSFVARLLNRYSNVARISN